jgi:DNA-binding NarL/FixJ family response regulator
VFTADSYQSALASIKAKKFDILLVDLGLPDGDGADLILRVCRVYPHAESYVLSVTDDGALRACKQFCVTAVY